MALVTGTCTAPCGLKFAPTPASSLGSEGASLYVNLSTGAARLRDSSSPAAAGETLIFQFVFEADVDPSNHGYGVWMSGSNLWDEWTEGYEYDTTVGTYSIKQFVPITTQLVETSLNKLLLVTYQLADHGVVVQSVRFPTCTAGAGACRTSQNCSVVDTGAAGPNSTSCDMTCAGARSCTAQCVATGVGLNVACADCYAGLVACTRSRCPGEFECPTPRFAGNGCLRCQVDKGCGQEFMACSGLDYLPLGSVLLPLPNN